MALKQNELFEILLIWPPTPVHASIQGCTPSAQSPHLQCTMAPMCPTITAARVHEQHKQGR